MSQFLQVFYVLLSAVLLALAIPNEYFLYGSPAIGLFSILPLYIAIYRTKSYKRAFLLCYLQAAVTHLLSSFWLGNFQGFAIFTLGASLVGTGFILGIMGLFFYFPAQFSKRENNLEELAGNKCHLIALRPVWFSIVYTLYEWCKSTGFLAYPWGTVSMAVYRWPLMTQIADITGTYGVTFLFVLFSACLGEGIELLGKVQNSIYPKKLLFSYKNTTKFCGALLLLSLFYGIEQYTKPLNQTKTMNTVLIQHNNDSFARTERLNIETSQRLTKDGIETFKNDEEKCDLVVWSEAVLSKRFPNAENYYNFYPDEEPLLKFVKNQKTPFIIGGPFTINQQKNDYGNSALLFDENGKFRGKYIKMHLVPFAELIPGREYDAVRKFFKKIAGSYGWAPGKKITLFEIPLSTPALNSHDAEIVSLMGQKTKQASKTSVKVSTPICFDDSALEVCRAMFLQGSECFVNITNDSWSKTKSAETQHFAVAHYRSIEFRTTTIRAANAGLSCVIDPRGRMTESLPLFEEGFLSARVPIYERQMTIYARFGNWVPHLFAVIAALFIYLTHRKFRDEDEEDFEITTEQIRHTMEWYDRLDAAMSVYDEIFAVDWSIWNW
ncbi:MAG: apolipoprotein N-acyltransferase [Treponema sp.]|nr:apolipoprotein N-acyltransferase [Candidatus Treponema equifaecale]